MKKEKLKLKSKGIDVIVQTKEKLCAGERVPVVGILKEDWIVAIDGKEIDCEMVCNGDGSYTPVFKDFTIQFKKDIKTKGYKSADKVKVKIK